MGGYLIKKAQKVGKNKPLFLFYVNSQFRCEISQNLLRSLIIL